ncbi:MAG: YceI family protein [Wenzhouxiangella sp.]|nr:MAG: YceI family protein [Wenzhouxiangella sp.]
MAKQGLIVLLALGLIAVAAAEERCYHGNADSGELSFRGEADGNRFNGRFRSFEVRVCMSADEPESARIEVTVETGSATVGNRQGDAALVDDELFAAERYPQAVWISEDLESHEDGYLATGELSLRGVSASQPVRLSFEPGDQTLGLSGGAEIMRLDYGVGQGEFEDPDFIRNRVDLSFDLALSIVE